MVATWLPPAFVAFCVAVAAEFAYWLVSADWLRSCAWPEPPEPRPPLPAIWVWSALWQVAAALTAAEAAEFVAVWSAPALVASCVAVAAESAPCSVDASWLRSWACPAAPDPTGSWDCEASCVVRAKFPANESAELSAVWLPAALVAV